MKWRFRIEGEGFDVSGVADLFANEVELVRNSTGRMDLILELDFSIDQPSPALDAAEELVAKLNGIAHMVHGNHRNLRVTGVSCDHPDKPATQFLIGREAIECRSRVGAGLTVTSGAGQCAEVPVELIGDRTLRSADMHPHLERALFLYGSLPQDWRGLYMVLEAAEDAHGGERGLIAKAWVPAGIIKDFKATANSYRAIRLHARHGSVRDGVDQPKLTLEEARNLIRTILSCWVKESA